MVETDWGDLEVIVVLKWASVTVTVLGAWVMVVQGAGVIEESELLRLVKAITGLETAMVESGEAA